MRVYEHAQDLWPALVKQAGLDVQDNERWWRRYDPTSPTTIENSYDADLLYDLRAKLFPGASCPLQYLLKTAVPPLSAERLLRVFFEILRPFSTMKYDILEMLSAAGARKGDDNIKIRFQLSDSDDPLDLLLNEFREQMDVIERRSVLLSVREWKSDVLWRIPRIAEAHLPQKRRPLPSASTEDQEIGRWIEQSRSTRRFESFPEVWPTGIDELDQRLRIVVDLIQQILDEFRRYGNDYLSARRAMERVEETRDAVELLPKDSTRFPLRQLYFLESDFWLASVGEWLLAVRVAAKSMGRSGGTVATTISELDNIIPSVHSSIAERDEIIRQLMDILNLPVWKKRHAVYAVWIGSQIWQALKNEWHFAFHLHNDILSFAFSGVHLATLLRPGTDEVHSWWTELRTPCANLPSGHRSRAIQPDFRVRRAPFSSPESDTLVVEVKQYKRSSTRNFSAALDDYAFACPKAHVLLANYGPISPRVLDAVSPTHKKRTSAVAFVRPDKPDNCLQFQRQIGAALNCNSKVTLAESIGKVELKWNAHPADLDLHLFQNSLAGSARDEGDVYFGRPKNGESIHLTADITAGFGPEALLFRGASGPWTVCVNQFSADGSLALSGATVVVYSDVGGTKKIAQFDCPRNGTGRWWVVCQLDFSAGCIRSINRLAERHNEAT